jgi:hypothetical protein
MLEKGRRKEERKKEEVSRREEEGSVKVNTKKVKKVNEAEGEGNNEEVEEEMKYELPRSSVEVFSDSVTTIRTHDRDTLGLSYLLDCTSNVSVKSTWSYHFNCLVQTLSSRLH